MTPVDVVGWLQAVQTNADQLAAAVRRAGLEAPVPTCPGWTTRDLVVHLGTVHIYVDGIVGGRAQKFPGRPTVDADMADPVAWFEAGATRLLRTLTEVDAEEPIWNWATGVSPARFWHRRMAHELVIHRVDAEAAAGVTDPLVPADLAFDGIDELMTIVPARATFPPETPKTTFAFRAADPPGEWTAVVENAGVTVARDATAAAVEPDVAVSGPAAALELSLYNRGPGDRLEIQGDGELLELWREHARV